MRFKFTQDSTGTEIETTEHKDLREATKRGKELASYGHVRIEALADAKPKAAKPKAAK